MTSLKTYFIIKLMFIYNFLNDLYTHYKYKIQHFYEYLVDYYLGEHDIWVFMPDHTIPISVNNIYNSCKAVWVYNNGECMLSIFNDNPDKVIAKSSWLSAKLRITTVEKDKYYHFEYDIDKFLEKFKVMTFIDVPPTLKTIYLTWCSYAKHWFPNNSFVEFMIIDNNGEEITININDNNECLEIKHNKIFIVVHSDNPMDETKENQLNNNPVVSKDCETTTYNNENIDKDE